MKRRGVVLAVAAMVLSLSNGSAVDKKFVCHVPPGNPENAHMIVVPEVAALIHQNQHGDQIGDSEGEVNAQTNVCLGL